MNEEGLKIIRRLIGVIMIALFLSGLTAIAIDSELPAVIDLFPPRAFTGHWLQEVLSGYVQVKAHYPFLLYGYDWLAFAHFIIALLFIGPYKDPVRNIWVIEFALLACVLVLPLALIAGKYRGIPLAWRLIDCSFGVFGFIPLWVCYLKIKTLADKQKSLNK